MAAPQTSPLAAYAADELERMRNVAEDSATELRAILDRIAEAGILAAGAYGAKIESRITLAADRLNACAVSFGHQLAKADDRAA